MQRLSLKNMNKQRGCPNSKGVRYHIYYHVAMAMDIDEWWLSPYGTAPFLPPVKYF